MAAAEGRILVVDDDQVVREIVSTIVRALGYQCRTAVDGQDAVEHLAADEYDVVITDMIMPRMDGMKLLAHIKEHCPRSDVMVITGHSDTYIYSNIINAGGCDFIIKPFEGDELEAKLKRIFRERRLIKGLEREIAERREAEAELRRAKEEVDRANTAKDLLIADLYSAMDEILANRDHYTFEHTLRVAEIAKRIAVKMGLPEDEVEVIERASLIHDIGKVAIPDDVLLKPGQFDPQDRSLMKIHPAIGASLFTRKHHDPRIAYIIKHHHERLDGTGYPDGLKGDDLNLMVRVVSIADVYEALVARRPYKKPMGKDDALAIMRMEAREGRLDGTVIDVLVDVLTTFEPLEITQGFCAGYMNDLELFRRKAYFREPMTGFYNYRYLYFLDDSKSLRRHRQPFDLLITNFQGLPHFYKQNGQALTDQVLDEIGQKLHDLVDIFNGGLEEHGIRMFRRSSDYLFYLECSSQVLDDFFAGVSAILAVAEQEWRIVSHPFSRSFPAGYSLESALNQLFRG